MKPATSRPSDCVKVNQSNSNQPPANVPTTSPTTRNTKHGTRPPSTPDPRPSTAESTSTLDSSNAQNPIASTPPPT
jgi:hypothetical protein